LAFPEFAADGRKILFFTRGRGRGHAVPDLAIAAELERLDPSAQVHFVSYATGAETFQAHNVPCIDLCLPEANPSHETLVLAAKLIGWLNPDLVVAHEEFMAMPAARIFDKPTVMLTDWFSDPARDSMTALRMAGRVLFLDEPGHFPEPPCVEGRVEYLGPVVRDLGFGPHDAAIARARLGITDGTFSLAVLPGSWREDTAPILDTVLAAFDRLPFARKRIFWMAGDDEEFVRRHSENRCDIEVRGYDPEIGCVMAAADVAVTKGTRKTLHELAALGKASVSLACTPNRIDHVRAACFASNEALGDGAGPAELAAAIERAARRRPAPVPLSNVAQTCAARLLQLV
jgi:predicted glycosyltransferase